VRGFRLFEKHAEFVAQARLGKLGERLGPSLGPNVTPVAVPTTIHGEILRRWFANTEICISV